MSQQELLEIFARQVVKYARDDVITFFDDFFTGKTRSTTGQILLQKYQEAENKEHFLKEYMIPYAVDSAIEVFLQVFDTDLRFKISIQNQQGEYVDALDLTDGCEAEYAGEDGWAEKYSMHRLGLLKVEHEETSKSMKRILKKDDGV
ncbi:hypothetical protein [Deinococcus roseus]|uniref:Uncharacterized protein n=1 Tax=Deinococcus roseus TaxID=392414 RepID=A0ABQ2DFY8_9DEIO|nr:hypothetical protein [Deinococcus roseus]GGJ54984.1 hypothetical protein GCM10008938_46300 [Deinococcus roseus]